MNAPDMPSIRPLTRAVRAALAVAALCALVVLVFGQTRHFDFVLFDDPAYVFENPHVNTGLSLENAAWAFTAYHAGNWHPLTWLSHMLDASLFGMDAGKHHLVSVFFHLLNTLLVFGLLLAATRRNPAMIWPCFLVAAVFAVHPLRAETVAWISERKDVLCAFFWLLTMAAYALYARKPSLPRYAAVAAAMILAMLAKPMAITLPCVLLLMDVWPLRRIPLDRAFIREGFRKAWEKAPLFGLSLALAVLTLMAQGGSGAVQPLTNTPLSVRLGNAPVAYVAYLGQTIWPFNLGVSYPLPLEGHPAWKTAAAILALMLVTAAVMWKGRGRPWLPVGWFFYLGTLVPVIGIVQVGDQAMADRYTYLPHLGVSVMAVWLGAEWFRRLESPRARKAVGAAVFVLLCAMAARAHDQVGTWRENMTLWSQAAKASPDSFLAQLNLATALENAGDWERAGVHYDRALEADPNQSIGHYNYGNFLRMLGNSFRTQGAVELAGHHLESALAHLDTAMALSPDHIPTQTARASALFELERYGEAEAALRAVLAEEPEDPTASSNLAAVLLAGERFAEAEAQLRGHIARHGESATDLTNLALALLAQNRFPEAQPLLQDALDLDPAYPPARNLVHALGGTIVDHPPAD